MSSAWQGWFTRFTRLGAGRVLIMAAAGLMALVLPAVAAVASNPPRHNEVRDLLDDLTSLPPMTINSPSTTTSTTTTTVARVALAAAKAPVPNPPAVPAAAAARSSDPRCSAALGIVEASGLPLPAPFEFRCPGNTQMYIGDRQHWGVTCSHASLCPDSAYVAVNPGMIGGSEARLRHVVAHEVCHAHDVMAGRALSESAADACAAAHGFPRV